MSDSFRIERLEGEVVIRAVHVASGKSMGFSHLAHRTLEGVRAIMDEACAAAPEAVRAFDPGRPEPRHAEALRDAVKAAGGSI